MDLTDVKNKKVGIFLNYVAASPAPELFASAIDVLIANNNDVLVYYCNEDLDGCSYNPIKASSLCAACKRNVKCIQNIFNDVDFIPLNFDAVSTKVDPKSMASFSLAAMSSIASLTKAVNEEQLNKFWRHKLSQFKENSLQLFNYFKTQISDKDLELLVCFNGRFFDAKPVVNAAISCDIDFSIVEVKKSIQPIAFVNELIHSIDANCDRAELLYNKDPAQATKLAEEFFDKKIRQEKTGDPVYTAHQKKGLSPDYLRNTKKKIIVVYPTTDDEYKFIGDEWDGSVPSSQTAEISSLCEKLPDYLIIVKMHPNQQHMPRQALNAYYDLGLQFMNCIVEPPKSKFDSYAFLFAADIVINFASTIGVEAVYFGKKVINIGDTNFSKMNIAPVCISGFEAAELILSGNFPAPNKLGAIKWGSYLLAYRSRLDKFECIDGEYFYDGMKFPNSHFNFLSLLPKLLIRILKSKLFS